MELDKKNTNLCMSVQIIPISHDTENMIIGVDEDHPNDGMEICEQVEGETHEEPLSIEPYVGMGFENEEEVRIFYNEYARRVGFSIRIGHNRRSRRDKCNITREYVCSKQGYTESKKSTTDKAVKERATTRVGCKAMIMVKRREGKWYITKFEKEHNHELASPGKVAFLRSHRKAFRAARKFIDAYDISDGDPSSIISLIDEGSDGFILRECQNYLGYLKQRFLGKGDSQFILEYFTQMQMQNPTFFYALQVNDEDYLTNVFWINARSKLAYCHFDEVVLFDRSYKTSRFKVPFTPFMGINHHQEPILFGCAFLQEETEASFAWLFTTWLKAMNGKHPKVIITDQNAAMRVAIARIFPSTLHKYSMWNVKNELQEKVANMYGIHEGCEEEFRRCIDLSETVEDFESYWNKLIDRYGLRDDTWVQSLYAMREKWVPSYVRDVFLAGLSTTQRSESINAFFDGYIHQETILQEFFVQFDKALDNQYNKELESDFRTMCTHPIMKTMLPMERKVGEIYTRSVFLKFQEELLETDDYVAKKIDDDGITAIYRVSKYGHDLIPCTVMYSPSRFMTKCSCRKFEFMGILCRHALRILIINNVFDLPEQFLLNRWTRDAKRVINSDDNVGSGNNCNKPLSLRYNELCSRGIKYAEEGAISSDAFNVAIRALRSALKEVISVKENSMQGTATVSSLAENRQACFPTGSDVGINQNIVDV